MRVTLIKPALFALLAVNALAYTVSGRPSESVDAIAWFALLALFEIETRYPTHTQARGVAMALDTLRLVAAASIVYAAIAYVREGEWLDALNAWLWIGVVIVLELEVRAGARIQTIRAWITALSFGLYGGLTTVACIWLWQGYWFEGYDATLWIAAFALIEMDLMKPPTHARVGHPLNS